MNKILFIIGMGCILFSCKKQHVEPASPQTDAHTPVNMLPRMVVNGFDTTTFQYNSDGLLKKAIIRNHTSWPTQRDSTTFEYNTNNLVSKKIVYRAGIGISSETHITYTSSSKIDQAMISTPSGTVRYRYHYNQADKVDYILEDGSDLKDSITVNNDITNNITYYTDMYPNGTYGTYGVFPCGIFYSPSYYAIAPNPTCSNLSINLQEEVAEFFIQMGEINFPQRNFFEIPLPRKYCLFLVNTTYTYTFDNYNRLTEVHGEFPNYAPSGSPIPGVFTYSVYY